MGAGASRATGERAVSVGGDVVGSLIVTGDNNNVELILGSEHGALLEQLTRGNAPRKRLRPVPLRAVPGEFAGSVDREPEARAILESIAAGAPVNVHGERGIGKTYTILRALNAPDPALAEGAVYLYAPGPLDDVRQLLFEAWYECEPPFKPSTVQLRRELGAIRGVAALDSVELERDAAQQLLLDASGVRVVISSRERVLLEGASIAVHGLATSDALVVIEQEYGRPLAAAERPDAERIGTALEGHPLKIREAVASARDAGRSLRDLAAELSASGKADAAVAADKLEAAGEDGRRLLAALALFGDASVGKEHLRAIAGAENFDQALMDALRRRDLRAHSPRYDLGATLASRAEELDLEPAGGRALSYFTDWARRNRNDSALLMSEAAAVIALLRWALDAGHTRGAIELGRAVDHAFALERRFGAWGQLLELVHAAALSAGDREAEAWALHQLGTRALCLGELAAGAATLSQARELRRELGDEQGSSYTAHNLSMTSRPRWYTRWVLGHTTLMIGLAIALLAAGVVAAATIPGGGGSQGPTSTPVGFSAASSSMAPPPSSSTTAPPTSSTTTTLTTTTTLPTSTTTSTPSTSTTTPPSTGTVTTSPAASLFVEPDPHLTITSTPAGIQCDGAPCQATFPQNSQVELSADAPAYWSAPGCVQPPPPPTGIAATASTAPSGSTTCTVTLTAKAQKVAVFLAPSG